MDSKYVPNYLASQKTAKHSAPGCFFPMTNPGVCFAHRKAMSSKGTAQQAAPGILWGTGEDKPQEVGCLLGSGVGFGQISGSQNELRKKKPPIHWILVGL